MVNRDRIAMNDQEKRIQRALGTIERYNVYLRGPTNVMGNVPAFECYVETFSVDQAVKEAICRWQKINATIRAMGEDAIRSTVCVKGDIMNARTVSNIQDKYRP